MLLTWLLAVMLQTDRAVIVCSVTSGGTPVSAAQIVTSGRTYMIDS